jgi:hypothetical protein
MNKKRKSYSRNANAGRTGFKFSKGLIITVSAAAGIVSLLGYAGIHSLIPVNGTVPVFAAPRNSFIKATHSQQTGYYFLSQSAGGVKGSRGGSASVNPVYYLKKGSLESVHLINEDYDTHSKHNFNIDQFKVHTKDLGYFESQTITFIADKVGTFEYYCTIPPEMRGTVTVEG